MASARLASRDVPDTVAPAAVSGLVALAGDGQVSLAWIAPADADFAGVLVIRRGGLPPDSRTWGSEDNGIYALWLWPGQVRDVSSNAAPKRRLGQFKAAIGNKAAKAASPARPPRADAPTHD